MILTKTLFLTGMSHPIFIIGAPRSGTSILTWCLGQHSNIQPIEETSWIARVGLRLREIWALGVSNNSHSHLGSLGWGEKDFYKKMGEKLNEMIVESLKDQILFRANEARKSQNLEPLDEGIEADMAKLLELNDPDSKLKIIRSIQDPKKRWVDGTPENTFHAYTLLRLFPQARFIHLIRKPDNVAASLMDFSSVGKAAFSFEREPAYLEWSKYVSHARQVENALGHDCVYRINYESMVEYPTPTFKALFHWLGENYESACLEPLSVKINSSKVSQFEIIHSQVRQTALNLYANILQASVSAPDASALQELIEKHEDIMVHYHSPQTNSGMQVIDWGPRETPEGTKFNIQPNGQSAMCVKVKGVSRHPKTHVTFGGKEISGADVAVQDEAVTFLVRDEIISKSGSYEVAIIEGDTGRKILIGNFEVKKN